MILINLDFMKHELTKNTLPYLKEKHKEILLNQGDTYDFNGKRFKNKTKLEGYLADKAYVYDKELMRNVKSNSRRTTLETVRKLYEVFVEETPLFIDRDRLYKLMLLSSNLMFSPNEKICFTIMFEDPYEVWTADKLVEEAKKNYRLFLIKYKIEESLDRYLVSKGDVGPLLTCEVIDGIKYYQIQFTNCIYYIRNFDTEQI